MRLRKGWVWLITKCFQEQGGRKTGKGETEERNVDLELGR